MNSKKFKENKKHFSLFRHAALMAISAVGEGCHKQMEALLPQIMDGVIQYLQDPVSIMKQVCFIGSRFLYNYVIY